VAALRDVVFVQPRTTLMTELIVEDFISVTTDTPAEDAAALLADYGFRAMPVVDEAGDIKGIITFDDALDLILPEELRRRVPKIFKYSRGKAGFVRH
jgi:Mg/Co/Ni transporter MgtE